MNFEEDFFKITGIFAEKFEDAYTSINRKGKIKLLDSFCAIYRKWYYSAFFDENILTPGHLVYRINEKNNEENNNGNYYVPIIRLKSKNRFTGFNIEIINYTADNHPIVDDLKIFASKTEIVSIGENGILIDKAIDEILKTISLNDSFYLEYLLYIGEKIGIFEKMPSIYSDVYRVRKNSLLFFKENETRACFEKITEAAISLSCERINDFFPDDQRFFSCEYIKNIIKEPIFIDDIFKEVYNSVGIGIEDIWKYEEDYENGEFCEFADAVLSSAYFLRILIDKWFIVPFGDYLKLIMPIYFYTYDFYEKMNGIIDESKICGTQLASSIYYPCSKYCVTPVAESLFDIKAEEDEYKGIFKRFPPSIIIDAVIMGDMTETLPGISEQTQESSEIYELKLKFEDRKDLWKVIEIEPDTNLTMLHIEICKAMNLYPFGEYSFFADENKSPFSEYTPRSREKRVNKKTETTTISDLKLNPKQKFIYRNCFDTENAAKEELDIFLEIEFMKIKEKNRKYNYPRVTRMSSAAKLMESDFEF